MIPFSPCRPSEKVQDSADVILRALLIGVVAAFGEDSQLPPRKVAVKGKGLFDVKDGAAVGIENEGGTAHPW